MFRVFFASVAVSTLLFGVGIVLPVFQDTEYAGNLPVFLLAGLLCTMAFPVPCYIIAGLCRCRLNWPDWTRLAIAAGLCFLFVAAIVTFSPPGSSGVTSWPDVCKWSGLIWLAALPYGLVSVLLTYFLHPADCCGSRLGCRGRRAPADT